MLKFLTGLPGRTAHPQKNEQCSPAARMQIFRSESNIKRATYLSRRESFLSSKDTFLSIRDIYLSMRTKKCRKRRLICSCVRGLKVLQWLRLWACALQMCHTLVPWFFRDIRPFKSKVCFVLQIAKRISANTWSFQRARSTSPIL